MRVEWAIADENQAGISLNVDHSARQPITARRMAAYPRTGASGERARSGRRGKIQTQRAPPRAPMGARAQKVPPRCTAANVELSSGGLLALCGGPMISVADFIAGKGSGALWRVLTANHGEARRRRAEAAVWFRQGWLERESVGTAIPRKLRLHPRSDGDTDANERLPDYADCPSVML